MTSNNNCYCIIPNCNNYAYIGTNIPEYCDEHSKDFFNMVKDLNMINKSPVNNLFYDKDVYEQFDLRLLYNHIGRILNNSYLMYNKDENNFYIVDFNNILDNDNKERIKKLHTNMINLKFEFEMDILE